MTLKEKKAALGKLYTELAAAQKDIEAGKVDQNRGEEIEAKAAECETLQKEVEQAERIEKLAAKGREIEDVTLPSARDSKSDSLKGGDDEVIGYTTPGTLFVNNPGFVNYVKSGASRGQRMAPVQFKGLREKFIPVTRKMVEAKAVPTIDTGVITVDRKPIIAMETQDDRTVLRDVLNVSQTDSSSVEYVIVDAYTPAADVVAESAAKPESTMGLSLGTAPVRTLAVHMPVTEQQLQDVPQMRNLIDGRLMYDLRKLEEKQVMYGSGSGQNLQGILPLSSVALITRSAPADTQNLDRVRIGITDVLVNGYEPNALVVHPYDWEGMILLKATTKEYIWAIVTDPQTGNSRIWGLRVVESVAAKNPASAQRYMLVGDFLRGATLWDRQQATVEVGYIDDQFILNQRTIRAEERVAFGVHAPKAFVKYETNAA